MHTSKFYTLAFSVTAVFASTFLVIFSLTRSAIESFPLDWGWVGFVFILGNGFFLSYGLINKKIDALERLMLATGLGFGITFTVMILLGVLWEVSLISVLSTQLTLLVTSGIIALLKASRIEISGLPPNQLEVRITREMVFQMVPVAMIGILAFAALYNALTLPAIEWDSLAYGVNYAKVIFQNGHIPLIAGPSIGIEMSAAYPPGVQLTAVSLYTLAREANDFYYRILSPIFSLATLLVTYKFAMLLNKNRTFSIYAISALVMIPFFWELFIQETYIMALTLMLTSAAYFFYKAHISDAAQTIKLEVIGILFCAFAALTSYMGLIAFGLLPLYALQKRIPNKRTAVLLVLGLAIILPWYLRNLVLLGNPVYPFFGVGYYLDPLLSSSTPQHFQLYTTLPIYEWTTLVSKIGVLLVAVGIVFFTFSSRREFRWALPLYLLLASLGIMAFHVAFPRYLILAIPTLCVIFSTLFLSVPKKHRLQQIAAVALIAVMVLTSAFMLPYINTVKPQREDSESQSEYLSRVFEEGAAWNWINENTPPDAKIATYDIKEYYLNRTIFSLDGNEAVPLYRIDDIGEAMQFLKNNGVGYILSVPWASPNPLDNVTPPAYKWCIITRYFNDPDYFPPVYFDDKGTTVYHVGALNTTVIEQAFAEKGVVEDMAATLISPLKYQTVNLSISKANASNPDETTVAVCYIPIPVDYRTGKITVSVTSTTHLDLQLWNERVPKDQLLLLYPEEIKAPDKNFIIAISPVDSTSSQSTLYWQGVNKQGIDKAGYFTIRVLDRSGNLTEPTVTLDIRFDNFYDLGLS
jgi:hypothetical protein